MNQAAMATRSDSVSIVNRDGTTNRIWLSSYAEGVPADIDLEKRASLNQYVDKCIHEFRERLGFVSVGTAMSNARRLDALVESFAGWLQMSGVKKGDRVAIMLPNTFQYPVTLFAALRIGAVVVNVNPLHTLRELSHLLKDSGAETIGVIEDFAKTVQDALQNTTVKRIVLTQMGDLMSEGIFNLKGRALNFVIRKVRRLVPTYSLPNAVWLCDALRHGAKYRIDRPPMRQEDLAFCRCVRSGPVRTEPV